jgi:hypothetical protein
MRRAVCTFAAVVWTSAAAGGQAQTVYAPTRDTLRFREVTESHSVLRTGQGDVATKSDHDGTIAVVGLPGDSVRAWYEALAIGVSSPIPIPTFNRRPATDSALLAPFHLRVDPLGRTTLLSAPTFPKSFEGLTDLSKQFFDFFLRLPNSPLRIGLSWSDTISVADSALTRTSSTSIASYRVERDTTVSGTPALVISMKQQMRSWSEGPAQGPTTRIESQMEGSEDGIVVFAPRTGRLLGRERRGKWTGTLTIRGTEGRQSQLTNESTYTSTIRAIP